ncbi:MAG: UPF0182 family protein [Gemmatimonadaceae bacterium]|nr:UPF0182 family protein [Gemmatimonadaceae bacterium]
MIIRRRGLLMLVAGVALVLAGGRAWGALIGDHAWFDALGYGDVWWWQTSVALTLKVGAGTIATLVMRAHLEAIRRSFVSVVVPGSVGNLEFNGAVPDRTIALVLWAVAFAIGVLLTVPIDDWRPLATVLDARPFGESDPYFQYDLSFWTAWLPFEWQAYTWALLAHAILSMLTIVGYVLTRGIGTDGRTVRVTRHARRHITVLGAMLLLLIAWSYRVDGFDRLVHGTGAEGAFGFADHRVGLPGGIVMQVVSLAAAGVVTWSAWSRQPRAGIAAVTTVLLMALLLRQGMPLLADSVDGGSDPVARERRYIDAGELPASRTRITSPDGSRRSRQRPPTRRRCRRHRSGIAPPSRGRPPAASARCWRGISPPACRAPSSSTPCVRPACSRSGAPFRSTSRPRTPSAAFPRARGARFHRSS